ncbi:MAG TPA: long-chain fatty acid--CoA ligase [Acetobacteraceae bacterium]|nr:long-chain fatty acid--CoA ligase [Acetobacteraceae bacterium]
MTAALARELGAALAGTGAVSDGPGSGMRFAELRAAAEAIAGTLARHGLAPAEPVHLLIGNRAADLAGMLGIWQAGGVVVPVHRSALAATTARIAALSAARFAVDGSAVTAIASEPPTRRPLLHDAALVIFTSGSTGLPKGVVIGHERMAGKIAVLDRLLQLRPTDVVSVPLQLTFIFGIWVSFVTLRAGACLALVPRFSAAAQQAALQAGATVMAAVPSMLRTMAAGDALHGNGPRLVLAGGEPLGPEVRRAVAQAWPGTEIRDLYGLTETGSSDFCMMRAETATHGNPIGTPTSEVAFRIADPAGAAVPEGDAGELQIRSPFGMLGYLDAPEATEASFQSGYFRTGDLARVEPDGSVSLVGRLKEIVSRGGNKVAPLEIDNLLGTHPDIAAALTAGVPDPRLGEALCTVVVPRPGATIDDPALRRWLGERLERFKLPDTLSVEDTLPVGPTGKASRAALRARFAEREPAGTRTSPR